MKDHSTLIIGASGFLGRCLHERLISSGRNVSGTFNRNSPGQETGWWQYRFPKDEISPTLSEVNPFTIVMSARLADPSATGIDATKEFETEFTRVIRAVQSSSRVGRFIYLSSDAVFSGNEPLRNESAPTCPDSEYGRRHVIAERIVLDLVPDSLIVRPSFLYGISGGRIDKRTQKLANAHTDGSVVRAHANVFKSPLEVGEAASLIEAWIDSDLIGIAHLSSPRISVHEFFCSRLKSLGEFGNHDMVQRTLAEVPSDTSLSTERFP
ncbi:MAG: sugar nucleotide-binding protein [Verrucomicrobiota bacterium]